MESAPQQFKIILGSSSVARRKIVADMGYEFTTMSADIDEKAIRKEKPEDLVMALGEAKADALIERLQNQKHQENDAKPTVVIAADTVENAQTKLTTKGDEGPTLLITSDQVVVYEGAIREKPSSKEEAREFMKGYSGGHAATVTSVVVTNLSTGLRKGDWDKVEIYFHDIPDKIIDNMLEEGIVLKVAGGLIIEHPLILPYVKEVVGGTDSVMGLPMALTRRLIEGVL
ncbi:uncharacterized protein LOC127264489 isoform X1 [Andrographis paniculata]|uniref:uncharacterized protein LOC127264489 isoform X1 n=1 Tax=Andrographis paniculata TaxID=175694 RepID=UPI0021E89037|nr:uncharacterized protein LOC127264489 isoform X1 [Andrographis paniculata]